MKAAVYYETGPPSVCLYEDVPDPVCGPGDVLVDVAAISIEGGDTLNRAGGEMATSPHVVGYQCAGTIAEVGADVHDRRPGQRVVCTMLWGSHAERVATPSIIVWSWAIQSRKRASLALAGGGGVQPASIDWGPSGVGDESAAGCAA